MVQVITQQDIQTAAEQLDVSPAAIVAVIKVESKQKGFLADGRPVILLERHVVYRLANAAGYAVDKAASSWCNPKSGGYVGQAGEWTRFSAVAQCFNRRIAIESCSWGLFQIMGFHWQRLGYASAEDFLLKMHHSEGEHLNAFCRFIKHNLALQQALQQRNWPAFAKGYNGVAYTKNRYDIRLEQAYREALTVKAAS